MSKGQIKVVVSPAGEVDISVAGVPGAGCTKVTEAIEKALGAVKSREKTPDYNRHARTGLNTLEQ